MNIHRKKIERIVITGSREDSKKAFDYCFKRGYDIKRSGPKRINAVQIDTTRFKIVAEREIMKDDNQ